MYITTYLLPQVTNREDFLTTGSFFDDDTGNNINITGTTLANSAAAFTSSAWTVSFGSIFTTSATSLTIPVPPINNQLTALTLTVGAGLNVVPGNVVQIADTATGLNKFNGYVTSYTASSGVLVAQIGWTFQFEIRADSPQSVGDGYSTFFEFGTTSLPDVIITASLANYISITDIGFFQILIPENVFKTILNFPFTSQNNSYAQTFSACMTMSNSVDTRQVFVGRLPVIFGGVTN
jgi:hypothetical protein